MLLIPDSFRKITNQFVLIKKDEDIKIHFLNNLDYYFLKIEIPEYLVHKLRVDVYVNYITLSVHKYFRKIYFKENADVSNIIKEYKDGIYFIKIKKEQLRPEEKLNKWTMTYGL